MLRIEEKAAMWVKEAFQDKDIEITVSDQMDETDYLLSTEANRKHLYKSMMEL